jgi:glycosyltransferase involved in cell wall biosynthesis
MRLLAWEVEARLLGETTEEPFVNERPGGVRDLKKLVFDRFTLRLFTGFVVISRHLESRIQPFLSPRAPILRLPVLVDTPRFAREGSKMRLPLGTIGYCGHLSHTGEAEFLLKAWSLVASAFPSGRLKIIGEHPDPQVFAQLKSLVAILRVEASVEFMGAVTRAELPSILAQADVMALPRADGLFSRAGMPNKLGEYLATGRPVVVTSTGDIGSYLEDRVSAYLVPPGDTVAFAEALRYVLAHPQDAAEVGRRGQAVAQEHLDMRRNCARLLEFIAGIGR